MFPTIRAVFAALLAVVSVGCATSSAIPLKQEALARIQSTRAHIIISQDEINADVAEFGSPPTLGLLGVLIDVSVTAKRASKTSLVLEPVRKQLTDFDFRADFENKFRTTLADLPRLKIDQTEITGQPYSVETHNRMRAAMSQDSLLVMLVSYQLSSDYRSLVVHGTATLWQRGQEEAQYLGAYRYLSAPISSKSGETAVKAWTNNNAESLRAAMREGIDETIRMLRVDFMPKAATEQTDMPLGADGERKVVTIYLPRGVYKGGVSTVKLSHIASEILSKDNGRIIFRSKYADRYTHPGHIHSATTRQRFEMPVAASSAQPSGDARR